MYVYARKGTEYCYLKQRKPIPTSLKYMYVCMYVCMYMRVLYLYKAWWNDVSM